MITPALTRRLATCCAYYSYVALQIDAAHRHEAAVSARRGQDRAGQVLGSNGGGQTNAAAVAEAERAIRPEAVAFGVFGLVGAGRLADLRPGVAAWSGATQRTVRC